MPSSEQAVGSSLEIRRLVRDAAYNAGRQIFTIVLGIGKSVLLARGLGVAGLGNYAVIVLFPFLLETFLNSGVQSAFVYFCAKNRATLRQVIQHVVSFSIVVSLLTTVIGAVVILSAHEIVFPGISRNLLLLAILISPLNIARVNFQSVFQGLEDFKTANIITVVSDAIIVLATAVFLWWLHLDVRGALYAIMIGKTVGIVLPMLILAARFGGIRILQPALSRQFTSEVVNYSLRSQLYATSYMLHSRVDVLLLNMLSQPILVGIYELAVRTSEQLWTVSHGVASVIMPRIASLGETDASSQITSFIARYVLWISVIGAILLGLISTPILTLVYGIEFRTAAVILRWLLPGIVLLGTGRIIAEDLAGRGRPQINAIHSTFGVIINIVVNILLIPRFGPVGAAIATSLSYSVIYALSIIAFSRLTSTKWESAVFFQKSDIVAWGQKLRTVMVQLKLLQ